MENPEYIFRVRVELNGKVISDTLWWMEWKAENHADAYRESDFHYYVKVTMEYVND